MKYIPKVCVLAAVALMTASLLIRIPQGLQFSTRGLMEFTQTILLIGICFSLARMSEHKG